MKNMHINDSFKFLCFRSSILQPW